MSINEIGYIPFLHTKPVKHEQRKENNREGKKAGRHLIYRSLALLLCIGPHELN